MDQASQALPRIPKQGWKERNSVRSYAASPFRVKPGRVGGSWGRGEDWVLCIMPETHRTRPYLQALQGSGDARSSSLAWLWAIGRHAEKAPNGRPSGNWPPLSVPWPLCRSRRKLRTVGASRALSSFTSPDSAADFLKEKFLLQELI